MSATLASVHRGPRAGTWLTRRGLTAGAIVLAGDRLLYGVDPALGLALFGAALALLSCLLNPVRADSGTRVTAGIVLAAGLLPVVVDANPLSVAFVFAGVAVCVTVLGQVRRAWPAAWISALVIPLAGPVRLVLDLRRARRAMARQRTGRVRLVALLGWLVPVGLSVVFFALFVDANPVLEDWLASLDPGAWGPIVQPERMLFWGALAVAAWPFLHVVHPRRKSPAWDVSVPARETVFFGPTVILRSLVLFNLVFGLQTALDATYLWAGHALPAGMTHASYAHRGAYPLVASALLAGAFAIAATRHERVGRGSLATTALLVLFLAQNVLLVVSSIRRLDLYVDAYGMTQWRLSAMIWMGLVCFGLASIVLAIVAGRGTRWIVRTNALAAVLVLYGCTFAPFADVIARSNLSRCAADGCDAVPLDWPYLWRLGPQIIPALDDAIRGSRDPRLIERATAMRARLAEAVTTRQRDWREWSFDSWRLDGYLARHGTVQSQAGIE
ncbi:DUF4153 domain-containing protein [uncultured Alsobacter sp.]|uniref:DUF4153 domain-containing protein n=1 Tax=uncultured Alsobacter sp. TaxID=1748258 RepID=UPI0025DE9F30|nr:DUF4173 domain-containing protein [uncultured Alsobacter sp.]